MPVSRIRNADHILLLQVFNGETTAHGTVHTPAYQAGTAKGAAWLVICWGEGHLSVT